MGIRAFWLDAAEPEYTTYDFDLYRYSLGSNLRVGNIYPAMYAKAFYDGLTQRGEAQPLTLIRCAWAGSQRYGTLVWSGDIHSSFESMQDQFAAGLSMSMAGIPWWTTDIGGFNDGNIYDPGFHEVLVRWFQYGAFCPVMRLHGSRLPWKQPLSREVGGGMCSSGADNEVWSFGEKVYEICVKYMALRERLRPYITGLMEEAHHKGTPPMRPMFYDFPDQETAWKTEDQYMFGPKVLMAPVMYRGMESREVWLPEGRTWIDTATGKAYPGGQTVRCDTPIESMPVFCCDQALARLIGG